MQTACGSSCVRTSTFTWTRTSAPRSTRTRPVITQCRPGDINRGKRATAPALPTRIHAHAHTRVQTHTHTQTHCSAPESPGERKMSTISLGQPWNAENFPTYIHTHMYREARILSVRCVFFPLFPLCRAFVFMVMCTEQRANKYGSMREY